MFGFKQRHSEIMKELKTLNFILEQTLTKLAEVEQAQEPIADITKELNETVLDNAKRLTHFLNDIKSSAGLPKTYNEEVTIVKKRGGRPKKKA